MAPQPPTSGMAARVTTDPSEMVSMSRLPRERERLARRGSRIARTTTIVDLVGGQLVDGEADQGSAASERTTATTYSRAASGSSRISRLRRTGKCAERVMGIGSAGVAAVLPFPAVRRTEGTARQRTRSSSCGWSHPFRIHVTGTAEISPRKIRSAKDDRYCKSKNTLLLIDTMCCRSRSRSLQLSCPAGMRPPDWRGRAEALPQWRHLGSSALSVKDPGKPHVKC